MQRIHIIIEGLVQGVGFRYFCAREAKRLHLTGFARNLSDGTVEVEAQGSEQALETFLRKLAQGPRQSRVDRMEQEDRNMLNDEHSFVIL